MIFKQVFRGFIITWFLLGMICFAQAETCKNCHTKVWAEGINKAYIHPPFLEEKCRICHVYENVYDRNKIKAIEKTTPMAYEHMASVSLREDVNYQVIIRVRDQKGKIKELSRVVNLKQLLVERDVTPPQILNVEVYEITPGVFFEAVIVWDTDEPATSQVEYGPTAHYGFISPLDENLVTHHVVKIANLGANEVYHFRVRSVDVYGNERVSSDSVFKVEPKKPSKTRSVQMRVSPNLEIRDLRIFKTPNNKVVFFWLTTRLAEGTVKITEISPTTVPTKVEGHATFVLKSKKEAGFKICYKCHSLEKLGISHPVGIPLTNDMHPPSDLPLADNMVTCDSCHQPHGSKYRYILRKPRGRELCVSCHGNRY